MSDLVSTTTTVQTPAVPNLNSGIDGTHLNGAKLMGQLAARFGVEPNKLAKALKQTCFRQTDGEISSEELLALAVVANEYGLNPFLKEIYAFRNKNGAIMPLVSIDGWLKIMHRQPTFRGFETTFGPESSMLTEEALPQWCEVTIKKEGLDLPIKHREYLSEVFMDTGPWKKHPRRMLEHKTMIQTIRYAFGVSGISDEDAVREMDESFPVQTDPVQTNPVQTNEPKVRRAQASVYPVLSKELLERQITQAVVRSKNVQGFDPMAWVDVQINPAQREEARRLLQMKLNPPQVIEAEESSQVIGVTAPLVATAENASEDDFYLPSEEGLEGI